MRGLMGSVLGAMLAVSLAVPVAAQTLERVREAGEFKIGYREDAAPFAFKTEAGEAAGYAVDLCRIVAQAVKEELGLAEMAVSFRPVTAENRFDSVQNARVDILCGPTSVNMARRALVDFSLFTFVDGASVLFRADGPKTFEELSGKAVGVRGGTSTEKALRNTLAGLKLDAEVATLRDHADGLAQLESGRIAAYFADQAILLYLASKSTAPEKLRLSGRHFTVEPYALALQRGDNDFRLLVDRTLARLYRSGDVMQIFRNNFGSKAKLSSSLDLLYTMLRLPE